MRLRASITIEIEAVDYVEAATHQRRLQQLFDNVEAAYPGAEFQLRERRVRAKRSAGGRSGEVTELKHYTGKMNRYG